MSTLLVTTTISVLRRGADSDDTEDADGYDDPYDEDQGAGSSEYGVLVRRVRADISAPSGSQLRQAGGTTFQADAFLIADPCGLRLEDVILDERTGQRYSISWCVNYDSPGHLIKSSQAALTRTTVSD